MLLTTIVLAARSAGAAEDTAVEARRQGDAVEVSARATLRAPLEVVWSTLTDYDHLSEFIPGMRRSRLLQYRGSAAIVEELGEARFLFLSFPIDVTLSSVEHPPHEIEVHVLRGNLRRLDGSYRIVPRADGSLVLHWRGLIEPATPLPPLAGEWLMRRNVERQFLGMVAEIERRAGLISSASRTTPCCAH